MHIVPFGIDLRANEHLPFYLWMNAFINHLVVEVSLNVYKLENLIVSSYKMFFKNNLDILWKIALQMKILPHIIWKFSQKYNAKTW